MMLRNLIMNALRMRSLSGEQAGAAIAQKIHGNSATMVARFGANEIKAVIAPRLLAPIQLPLRKHIVQRMSTCAGFFPPRWEMIERFSALMIEAMRQLDVLGSWRIEERYLRKYYLAAQCVELRMLEPYFSENPWSQALEGKRVLVVHPFSTTIERQYHEKREKLFPDQSVLPRFASLQTVKAVQTIAGEKSSHRDWFEALDAMKAAIDGCTYDVAILGCGAYGFPLAAHVKRQGKKAVHLGGPTQILFGIRGKRWDDHPIVSRFYNEHWVRPAPDDTPQGARKVENGCYW